MKNSVTDRYAAVPASIRALVAWCPYKTEARDNGKTAKVPYQLNGAKASPSDPATWGTFDAASGAARAGGYAGIGVMLTAENHIVGIDLDHCRDQASGAIDPEARRYVAQLDSYTEISPSGDGLHILALGSKPQGRCKLGDHEIYGQARFFTITGQHLPGTPDKLHERQKQIDALHSAWFATERPAASSRDQGKPQTLTDDQVIDLAGRGAGAGKFRALFRGDVSGFTSPSEADFALCRILAYYTGDTDQIARLMRASALADRDKWQRSDYLTRTIAAVLTGQRKHYSGKAAAPGQPSARVSSFVVASAPASKPDAIDVPPAELAALMVAQQEHIAELEAKLAATEARAIAAETELHQLEQILANKKLVPGDKLAAVGLHKVLAQKGARPGVEVTINVADVVPDAARAVGVSEDTVSRHISKQALAGRAQRETKRQPYISNGRRGFTTESNVTFADGYFDYDTMASPTGKEGQTYGGARVCPDCGSHNTSVKRIERTCHNCGSTYVANRAASSPQFAPTIETPTNAPRKRPDQGINNPATAENQTPAARAFSSFADGPMVNADCGIVNIDTADCAHHEHTMSTGGKSKPPVLIKPACPCGRSNCGYPAVCAYMGMPAPAAEPIFLITKGTYHDQQTTTRPAG